MATCVIWVALKWNLGWPTLDRFHCAWTVLLGTACFPSARKVRYEKALQVPKERIIYQC